MKTPDLRKILNGFIAKYRDRELWFPSEEEAKGQVKAYEEGRPSSFGIIDQVLDKTGSFAEGEPK